MVDVRRSPNLERHAFDSLLINCAGPTLDRQTGPLVLVKVSNAIDSECWCLRCAGTLVLVEVSNAI